MLIAVIIVSAVLAFVLFFTFLVFSIIRILARKSGLSQLGVSYPGTNHPPGDLRRLYILVMNGITFKGTLSMNISGDGLYVTTNKFFKWLGRVRPALIPWDEIRIADEKKKVNMREAVGLAIGDPSVGSMTVLRKDFTEMEPYLYKKF